MLQEPFMTRFPGPTKRHRVFLWLASALLLLIPWHHAIVRSAYRLSQNFHIAETRAKLAEWPQMSTRHFRLYYQPDERAQATLTLDALNRALPGEEANLQEIPPGRLTVVLYPTQAAMNRAVGVNPTANNIGYDYNGVIDILSPSVWIGHPASARSRFLTSGPAPHELGHALLNLKAQGNYPDWFNEGVAQYEDWRSTGYLWLTHSNSLKGRLYSMDQLTQNFYGLSNQSLAYREGLSLVQYLEHAQGQRGFHRFLDDLQAGQSFSRALNHVYHLQSPQALFKAWQTTLR